MIEVLYFAAVREATGVASEQISVDALGDAPDIEAFWGWLVERYPEAARWRRVVRVAINQDFVEDATHLLEAGDEIALIPPVSGGSGRDEGALFAVTSEALDAPKVEALVKRHSAGALVTFQGMVRDHTGDREVARLEYEAYESMALAKLRETAEEAQSQWPDITAAIHHRHGVLGLGDVAVVVCVASPHRKEAFAACAFIIDRLKEVVPIWKKEVSPDGSEWVGWGP